MEWLYLDEDGKEQQVCYGQGVYGMVSMTDNPKAPWRWCYYFDHKELTYVVEKGLCASEEEAKIFCNEAFGRIE